jgi:uncharacterized circularly permuted ATP-grasp superfamily protein/uncharacterized alpha-E superfamily protein
VVAAATPPRAYSAIDEMVDGSGHIRPHWRDVIGAFAAVGEQLSARAHRLDIAFAEEGVTAVLPGTGAAERTWHCDPVPLPLAAAEFARLAEGLAQRARLLEAVLDDIYGKQTLLAEGLLPPALVYANPAWLRACRDTADGQRLQLYAADLVRGPDGAWRVVSDRTGAPAGLGTAGENRRLLARVLPEVFRPVQVRQLRPFFDRWQDSLQRLAPPGRANPAVALLTPGTGHPHWFEHLFLARELSCALVEPGDLTVRNGALFLKTLKGLQQVDVLVRRGDGRLVDPLELEGGGLSGVPGLLDAVRAGNLRIVNDPGSAAAEAPALAAFLPALAPRLLGEELKLPSVPTLWLGDSAARAKVAMEGARWRIRSALDCDAAAPSAEMITARPWACAATERVSPSVAPCLDGNAMAPRPVLLRLFLVRDGAQWHAMPGGLARVLAEGEQPAGRLPPGGLSKDVWVLSEDRDSILGPAAQAVPPLQLRRTTGDLPSRVADNLYWFGRTVERLERSARLVRAAISRVVRGAAIMPREVTELDCLLRCLAEANVIPREAAGAATQTSLTEALLGTVRDGRQRGAIARQFNDVARLTESVRDRLTGDMYATFTSTLRWARDETQTAGRNLDALSHGLASVQRFSAAVAGMAAENMVRGGGWLFLDLGRRIERAQAVTTEVAIALDQPASRIETGLRLVLELCDSAITYRSRYLTVIQPAPVLDLVLADQGNPRGLAFQLLSMHGLLDELSGTGAGVAIEDEQIGRELMAGAAAGLLAEIEALVMEVLAAPDQAAAAAALPARLRAIGTGLTGLSDRITRRYFALLPQKQALGWDGAAAPLQGAA